MPSSSFQKTPKRPSPKPTEPADFQVSVTPEHVSVFLIEKVLMTAVAQASLLPNGTWYFNRMLVKNEEDRGRGLGSQLLERFKEELKKAGCRRLVVEPGGYGVDPVRQRRFYSERGFVEKSSPDGKFLEWRP